MDRQISNEEVKRSNKELHDIEARYYDLLHPEIWNKYEQWQINRDINKISDLVKQSKANVLDVGCGTGNLTIKFIELGYKVTALDISENMLKILDDKISSSLKDNVNFVCEDIDNYLLATDKMYDVICFSSVLHHLGNYFYTLDHAISRLKDGGIIYIVHEPLAMHTNLVQNYVKRSLSFIDGHLYRRYLAKRSKYLKLPNLDYTISDIHSKDGLKVQQISTFLNDKGMEIIFRKQYANYKNGIVCLFGNFLYDVKEFKMIAQKREIIIR